MVSVVAVSGSLRTPSSTTAVLEAAVAALGRRRKVEARVVELSGLALELGEAIVEGAAPPALAEALEAVAGAGVLVVGTPVYRASYTGLFKQFFDQLPQDALIGTPVLLAAAGGNELHSLVIEHELRPLFGFFRALPLPLGIYARAADFGEGRTIGRRLSAEIEAALDLAEPHLPR